MLTTNIKSSPFSANRGSRRRALRLIQLNVAPSALRFHGVAYFRSIPTCWPRPRPFGLVDTLLKQLHHSSPVHALVHTICSFTFPSRHDPNKGPYVLVGYGSGAVVLWDAAGHCAITTFDRSVAGLAGIRWMAWAPGNFLAFR